MRVKSYSACGNCTLGVEINLVRIEITLVRVINTFVPVEVTLRVGITLCIQKLHSFALYSVRQIVRSKQRHSLSHYLMMREFFNVGFQIFSQSEDHDSTLGSTDMQGLKTLKTF
jgi:hypothetical protein